ncbi:MAG: hypothetical protein ACYDAN_09050 [Candidatus Limnocylindrales bacterium]
MKTRLASTLLLTTVALAACTSSGASAAGGGSSPAASPASSGVAGSAASQAQQVSEANGVTVMATWGGTTAGGAFDVALDTHSGSLDDIDLATAILRNDRGEKLVGASWSAPAGGHHRAGRLTFTGDAASVVKGAAWVELVLPNVGGVPERVLRWTVGA